MSHLTDDQKTRVRDMLAALVRIPSVNESDQQANQTQAEKEIAGYVERTLVDMGMTVQRYPHAGGRDNLVGHWSDATDRKSFAFQSHMDTVSVKNMTRDPFAADVQEGKMWGRGTCDTKGSLAAYLTGLAISREQGLRCVDDVHFIATVAEETGCKGAESLTGAGFKVDAIAVGEPTRCKIVTAHKGTCWNELRATGKSCHASTPEEGHNAVYAMARAIRFIEEQYIPTLTAEQHPLLGSPTLSVGKISGGVSTNIVPASCTAALDFRILPTQNPGAVRANFLERLRAAVPNEKFTLKEIHTQPGVETPTDHPWPTSLLDIASQHTGQSAPEGVNYFADSGPFHAAGIPCILFGPGDIAQAHTADEFLDLDQLYLATEIVLDCLRTATTRSLVTA